MSDRVVDYKLYFHSSKDDQAEDWRELGASTEDPGYENFRYVGYELGLACTVDLDTGECMAYGVIDGKDLVEFERPVRV